MNTPKLPHGIERLPQGFYNALLKCGETERRTVLIDVRHEAKEGTLQSVYTLYTRGVDVTDCNINWAAFQIAEVEEVHITKEVMLAMMYHLQ